MFSKALCFPEKYQFIRSGNRFLISTVVNDTAKAMLVKRGLVGMNLENSPALSQTYSRYQVSWVLPCIILPAKISLIKVHPQERETPAVIYNTTYKRDQESQVKEKVFSGYLETFISIL